MMKWIWCFSVAAMVSCNIRNEEAVEAPQGIIVDTISKADSIKIKPDTLQQVAKEESKIIEEVNSNSRKAKKQKPLLIARGSEPGWYAEFFADHLRMLIDNGTDSVIVERDFSGINTDPMYTTPVSNTGSRNNGRMAFTVSISNKKCVEASGEKREKEITILYRGKQYKGCATANMN
ncbi:MAG: hypothetical protein H0W73_14245 [Bacteroidetes bacterium]|nr:hypothetical protein [Bacteroidota bacterium]